MQWNSPALNLETFMSDTYLIRCQVAITTRSNKHSKVSFQNVGVLSTAGLSEIFTFIFNLCMLHKLFLRIQTFPYDK